MMKNLMLLVAVLCLGFMGCEDKNTVDLTYNCIMNGYGNGHCAFTNAADKGTGAKCGKIKVSRRDGAQSVESEVFCSGKVEASSTKKVEFSIPAVNSLCENEGKWTLACEFDFIAKE
jgi:hypothetical protein